jgi:hypothetical protein
VLGRESGAPSIGNGMSGAKSRNARGKRSPVPSARRDAREPTRGRAPRAQDPRIQAAWRRASIAKRLLGVLGVMVFGAGMALSRSTFAGHPKQAVRPLSAPREFVDVVRQNLLQAGLVAPANAPPGAATTVS